ncbi:hypothetical protein Pmani_019449 [Petrolisthes manimaculis]|uniref:Uncharacterized protein n=1 Tax=Petrolisthes manimaculis TaxID=1843537 RepID=A0AAE1U3Y3_9EUCA|nr:hypothetical protein Pmani_019449 [Petrolisthes manimaculis]
MLTPLHQTPPPPPPPVFPPQSPDPTPVWSGWTGLTLPITLTLNGKSRGSGVGSRGSGVGSSGFQWVRSGFQWVRSGFQWVPVVP